MVIMSDVDELSELQQQHHHHHEAEEVTPVLVQAENVQNISDCHGDAGIIDIAAHEAAGRSLYELDPHNGGTSLLPTAAGATHPVVGVAHNRRRGMGSLRDVTATLVEEAGREESNSTPSVMTPAATAIFAAQHQECHRSLDVLDSDSEYGSLDVDSIHGGSAAVKGTLMSADEMQERDERLQRLRKLRQSTGSTFGMSGEQVKDRATRSAWELDNGDAEKTGMQEADNPPDTVSELPVAPPSAGVEPEGKQGTLPASGGDKPPIGGQRGRRRRGVKKRG